MSGPSRRVFFSHGSEDKSIVEQLYHLMVERHPDVAGWIDRYEIVGGEVLIDKITAGIQEADKFLIFLSAVSATKPWVNHELRQAFTKELEAVDPAFIIPVKLGPVPAFPAFLKPKKYIDLDGKTEDEAVEELYEAIIGQPYQGPEGEQMPNLRIIVQRAGNSPRHFAVLFKPQNFAEDVSFIVRTSEPIVSAVLGWDGRPGMTTLNLKEARWPAAYAIRIHNERILAGQVCWFLVELASDFDPTMIADIGPWDGDAAGAEVFDGIRYVTFG